MRRLAARLAVGVAIVASATAVPFFLEQTTHHEFKSAADLEVACAAYRTNTANSLYTSENTQIAYETVCGKKDPVSGESPGTDRLLCQEFGWFPPTSQITSVCDLNNLYQNFLQCWGSGGLLTRLVENGRFASVATDTFGALESLVTEQKNLLDSKDTSFLSCPTADFDGGPANEALAYSLNAQLVSLLGVLKTNSAAVVINSVPNFSLASDPTFMCKGHHIILSPDPKVAATLSESEIDADHTYLSLCAAHVRAQLMSLFDDTTLANTVDEVGCYILASGEYTPYVKFATGKSCADLQTTTPRLHLFTCVFSTIPQGTQIYYLSGNTFDVASYVDAPFVTPHVGIFHCRAPWLPRGALLNHTCGTTYAPATLTSPTRKVTTLIQAGSELECVDACTLTPACAGYIWTGDAGARRHECDLLIDNAMANPGVAIAQLPSRLPLRLSGNSGATVENGTVDLPEPYVAKTMTIRQHGEAHGPWLVYGYTTQSQLQQVSAGLTVTRDGPQAPRTPEACGAHCAATATCRFAMWLSSQEPCHYYLTTSSTFPSAVFANPGQCANIGVFRMPDPEYGNSSQMAVCNAAPMCTWHADYGCTDVFRPTTGPYSGVPTTIPVVYAVPDLDVATGATVVTSEGDGWCPGGAVCNSCKEAGCADAETIIFPSTVDVFDDANSGGCPNLRVATIMSSTPQFKNNSFSKCPRLEAVALRNTSCVHPTVPSLGCNAIFEAGAVPSCVGPTPGKFGYALHGAAVELTGCADCAICASSAGGLEGLGVFSVTFTGDIASEAFRSCGQIQEALFPGTTGVLLNIGTNAFFDADALVRVDLGTEPIAIGNVSFSKTARLERIAGGAQVVSVGRFAFRDSGFVGAFPLSNVLTHLEPFAFYQSNVAAFNTGSLLTTIPEQAFKYSGIRAVVLGASLATIGSEAFYQATLLSEVEFVGSALTTITHGAFQGCTKLTKFEMPAGSSLTLLGSSSFFDANVRTFSFSGVSAGEFSAAFLDSGCSDLVYTPGTPYINCEPAIQETCSSSSDSPVCATAVSIVATSDVPD